VGYHERAVFHYAPRCALGADCACFEHLTAVLSDGSWWVTDAGEIVRPVLPGEQTTPREHRDGLWVASLDQVGWLISRTAGSRRFASSRRDADRSERRAIEFARIARPE
jgi:hypothetical protein